MLRRSKIASVTIRIIYPFIILFGVYLIMNGHISPGGGFQGGAVLSVMFICRGLIHEISDISENKVKTLEKLAYILIILFTTSFIFCGAYIFFPQIKEIYLIAINLLIGLKVACGFLVIFYRFIVYERM